MGRVRKSSREPRPSRKSGYICSTYQAFQTNFEKPLYRGKLSFCYCPQFASGFLILARSSFLSPPAKRSTSWLEQSCNPSGGECKNPHKYGRPEKLAQMKFTGCTQCIVAAYGGERSGKVHGGKRKKALVLRLRALILHTQISYKLERKIKSVFDPSFHAVKCENEKTSIGRVLHHITVVLICALVDWVISKEAHGCIGE